MAEPRYRATLVTPEPARAAAPAPVELASALHTVLRVGAGLLFMQHGLQKLFGLFGAHPVPLASPLGVAGMLEVVGGLLIVIGLFTRPVALVLVVEMLTAMTIAHLPRGGAPVQNGAELPMLYALIFAFLAANGAGRVSVDASLTRRAGADRGRPV